MINYYGIKLILLVRIHSWHAVVCQNLWSCSAPNEKGQLYIPNELTRSDIATTLTESGVLLIYRVPNLSTNCYGRVTALEYCYRYTASNTVAGQATFNWTVLVLKDTGSNFVISHIFAIQSRGSMDDARCTTSSGQVTCCDRTGIDGFDLPMNFIFGVTESARETLLEPLYWGFMTHCQSIRQM